MTVEIENVNGCQRNLRVEVPAAQVEQEIDVLARKYAGRAKVPGFRPGKVPLSIIRQRYAADLRGDATQEIIQRTWSDAVKEHNLKPLGEPVVKDLQGNLGDPLRFTLYFEVLPDLEVKDYHGVRVTVPQVTVDDADVDQAMGRLSEQHAQFTPADEQEIRDGHLVTITLDGEFEGGGKPIHEENLSILVGAPDAHPAFSENLLGAKTGDLRCFDVSYPENHPRRKLAGKTIHYRATVKDVKEKHLPALSDDFAKDLGSESLEQLRSKIRDELITNRRQSAEKRARDAVIDEVVRLNPIDVPDCLVREELQNHARRISTNLAQQGIDVRKTSIDWNKLFEEERPAAELAVRRSIILDAVAHRESLEISDPELDAEFQKLAEGTQVSAAAVRARFEKDNKIQDFREHLRQNKALDFIFRNATISEG